LALFSKGKSIDWVHPAVDRVHDRAHGGAHGHGDGRWPEISPGIKSRRPNTETKKTRTETKKIRTKKIQNLHRLVFSKTINYFGFWFFTQF
jgi:hypothetical protein